jgi:DNA segregation ATPase FtsK/SpoIIIE, S-DNA-T family
MTAVGPGPTASGGGGPRPLTVLGTIALLVGAPGCLGLFGVPQLGRFAAGWRWLFGWLALPVALALVAVGVAALIRRHGDPWQLPWGRALGVEVATAAVLALASGAFGPRAALDTPVPPDPGPGGLVGWSLQALGAEALGPIAATLAWFALGTLGVLAAFRVGAAQVAAALETVADTLSGTPDAPVRAPSGPAPHDPTVARRRPGGTPDAPPVASDAAPGVRPSRTAPPPQVPLPSLTARDRAGTASPRGGADRPGRRATETGARAVAPGRGPGEAGAARRAGNLPAPDFLGEDRTGKTTDAGLQAMAATIERALASFGVPAEVVTIDHGPTVTRFGVRPGMVETGGERRRVKVARIAALRRDLALALAAPSVRIEAPIPGQPLVGIEVPSPQLQVVGLKGLLDSQAFQRTSRAGGMAIALGRDVAGGPVVADLSALPHLLVAGATGSGKSVCLDAILSSLLFQNTPDALRLVLIDPKRVELARYNGLPHLVAPVVTEVAEVVGALRWVIAEMDRRYRQFGERGARNRAAFNTRSRAGEPAMPALVVIVDEMADVMLTAPDPTESLVVRLAQLGRATGIHLVLATQRPSVDVLTGLIKANFPARIAFAVASSIDSRVILDHPGAEGLLGRGDMLYQAPDAAAPRRAQGVYVSDAEIGHLVAFWSSSHWSAPPRTPPWHDLVTPLDPGEALYERAVALAGQGKLTASLLQRRLRLGYRTARDLYDRLAAEGHLADDATESDDRDWVDDEFDPG